MKNNIINFIIKLKNASLAKHLTVLINKDFFSISILKALYKSGYIQGYTISENSQIKIYLRYSYHKSVLQKIKLVSTPSHKIFIKYNTLLQLKSLNKTFFISTDLGVLNLYECKLNKRGGLLLFLC
uniref:Ribosomal protein S8 n=1 Tax=Synura synuroidea TaxID=47573 RepID=Q9MGC0_9STRA|nr:ribosomal protein S8 [Synura synuroidea]AAF36929.1 ribosomal protein S8 [Synura synuroidea]